MHRIPLSNAAFEGDNNVYLFSDGAATTLVDTGDWLPGTREQLVDALAQHGVGIQDIDRILLTHWHMDHTGLAGDVQAESGATVFVHEADAPLVARDEAAWAAMRDQQERCFDEWGMPEAEQAALRDRLTGHHETGVAPEVQTFAEGDSFAVDGGTLTVCHASGHAAGSCWFELEGADGFDGGTGELDGTTRPDGTTGTEILSGDVLLPKYTPNVGGADVRVTEPLEKYVRALRRIADADYDRAWPGHRDPIAEPTARAEAIIDHHEERAFRVLAALEKLGPSDAWTVSSALFGDLDDVHVLHGPGEAFAHLDHLERAGTVLEDGGRYRLADGVATEVQNIDTGRWPLQP